MIGKKMEAALNEQVNAELYSSYLYLSMAAYFESTNWPGMATWMRLQAEEEKMHGLKFFDYIVDRGGRVKLTTIAAPETEWASPLATFQAAYAHEQKVTSLINDLVKLSREEGDTASDIFLQWFVTEQVEEEKNADDIVQKLTLIKEAPQALFMLDKELGARQPATVGTGAE